MLRRLTGDGIIHAFSHEMAVVPGGRTACGIAYRPYELLYEDSHSSLRHWYQVINRPDGPITLRERSDGDGVGDVDCMSCLVAMQAWEP